MIQVLDKNVSDKIAAGEVIDRPVSIAKELIENSLDAGADRITIEIKNGGKSLLRVTDNGCGIPGEEAEMAFLRHATSKIRSIRDLESIGSLGFRGEALASIAAVTRTTLITKEKNAKIGRRIGISGGNVIENSAIGCPDGTSIIVTDLFYNTPARRNFLKSDSAESSMIIELVTEFSLAYSMVSFQLINNGKVLFTSTGDGDLKKNIITVTRQKEYEDLIEVEKQDDEIRIRGCISRPSLSRASRRDQVFIVNGRIVKNKVLEHAVSRAYRERLFQGRYPVIFLLLDTDPADLDVNIHPTKREIRFHDEKRIEEAVTSALLQALTTDDAVIHAADYIPESTSKKTITYKNTADTSEQVDIKQILETKRQKETALQNSSSPEKISLNDSHREYHSSSSNQKEDGKHPFSSKDESSKVFSDFKKNFSDTLETGEEKTERKPEIHIPLPQSAPFSFEDLKVTGCIFDTYITAVDQKNFYLIDQHAAHERVFYEKLVGNYMQEKKSSQPILTPILLDLPLTLRENEYNWMDSLRDMGYAIEEFGPNSYIIKEIPTFMDLTEAENFVRDYTENIDERRDLGNQVVIDKLITKSCKSAVKAHDHLSFDEMKALLLQLASCRNPFSCPHGRPTFIRFSQYDLEKFFKRVQ